MSQFVWTCRCGWKTTVENASLGHRGQAPAACRRCGGSHFTVTSEKHARITLVCKNKSCRADFIGTWGTKYCPKCRGNQGAQRTWDFSRKRKYDWTPERDQLLRDHYRNNPTEIAARFFPAWPKHAVAKRAQDLGLCRVKEKPWTKAEDARLLEWAGHRTADWMQKQLRTRTVTAIVVRLKRLHISRRIQADGLTLSQLEKALGVDHRQLVGWWRSGRLKGAHRTNANEHERYEFQEHDVAEFVLANPSAFRLDRVDQAWFMGLMRDVVTRKAEPRRGDEHPPRREQAPKPRREASAAEPSTQQQQVACVGVDEDAPCPGKKQVLQRRSVPSRCPDCTLEYRRRLRFEELARLQRIHASTPPVEATEVVGS